MLLTPSSRRFPWGSSLCFYAKFNFIGIGWKAKKMPANPIRFIYLPIRELSRSRLEAPVTFFVGENGSGKSTLLEAIADLCDFPSSGGERQADEHSMVQEFPLHKILRLSWMPKVNKGFFLRSETYYNFASLLSIGGYEILTFKEETPINAMAANRCMNNRTANPLSPFSKIASKKKACRSTCSTSPRQRCHRCANWPFCA